MPLGILSDDSMRAELEKLNGKVVVVDKPNGTSARVVNIKRGRGNQLEIPSSLREVIAEEVICGGDAKLASEKFGVSLSSISAYKHDATSTTTYNEPDKQLNEANNEVRDNITSSARFKLMMALEHVTEDKMGEAKLRDIAAVAQSMSGIIKNMEPQGPQIQQNTQVIVYRPRMRDESEFDVISVNE